MNKIITDKQIKDVTNALLEIPVAGKHTHSIIKYLEQLPPVPLVEVDEDTTNDE